MSKELRLHLMFTCFGKLFVAGTQAKGVLKVYTLNETKIKKIKIGVIGNIILEGDENGNYITTKHEFYKSEEHIFVSSDLLTNDDYDEQLLEYAVPLANNLPPSIALKEGCIVYHLYASMEEEFPDGTTQNVYTEANISIVSLVNCNTIPKAAKEKYVNSRSMNRCLCLQSDEENQSLQISPRAYVPGDCIRINAVIFNAGSSPMCYVQVALVQKVKLKYEDRCVKVLRIVSETKHGTVLPQQVQVWHDELLRIPPLPPTTTNDKHLQITYKLRLIPKRQNTDNGVSPFLLQVPVVIGNLPLDSTLNYFNPLPRCESFGNKVLPIGTPYQELAKAEVCIQKCEGSTSYVPSYITYTTERGMETVNLD